MKNTGRLPFDGLRVIDVTTTYAGPITGKLCAEMGAEVIKVESIQRYDVTRGPVFPDNEPGEESWNRGGVFHMLNCGKRDITLDLNSAEGKEILKSLVKISDVLIENFSPRVMKNLGLSYEELKIINPRLIMASVSGFGQTGPRRDHTAYAPVMEAASGLPYLTRDEAGTPHLSTGLGDMVAGTTAAAAIALALYHRELSGEGEYLDIAGAEAVAAQIGEAFVSDRINDGQWDGDFWAASLRLSGVYQCRGEDKWIAISITNEDEWRSLCRVLDLPEQSDRKEISRSHIEQWSCRFDHREAQEILQQAGIPSALVADSRQVILDPHLGKRRFWQWIEHDGAGKRPFAKSISCGTDVESLRPAPRLGQDNEYVLMEILGMSREDVQRLAAKKVIGHAPLYPPTRAVNLPVALKQGFCELDPDYKTTLAEMESSSTGVSPQHLG